ncbi:radical SAM/SPASM domain-containing protein [Ideonella sp. BN130291]|uniref:radical SAM/SPASM domain-containing protein n=1 Tax=Ideonella sp. BN130291 TaxID=3112940 RepID=UPI002E255566|nr:radical SAM protein [Ideonella sp. BN130291]
MSVATISVAGLKRCAHAGPVEAHCFDTEGGTHALLADGSRVYDVPADFAPRLDAAARQGRAAERDLLSAFGLLADAPAIGDHVEPPVVNALALAVSEHCNLACGYCYADGGSFGGTAQHMPWEVARDAVQALLARVPSGGSASLAFLGGEPLLNRTVLRQATELAASLAAERGIRMRFALTTNATVVNEEDVAFLSHHGFTVTVSIDGEKELHDALRPTVGGTGSYERIVARLRPLLAAQGPQLQVSARVTVTPCHTALRATLDHLLGLGFHSVGFSPSLSARDPALQLSEQDLQALLAQMVDCALAFEQHIVRGEPYPFSNMLAALQELHRGTHRPLPCGAGAGYLGVSANGEYSACHRFVADPRAAMGSLGRGIDESARERWLQARHVDRQEPCRSCWARYLCGGGCHHEVLNRGRVACDFIRGWLHHTLGAYVRIAQQRPDLFR